MAIGLRDYVPPQTLPQPEEIIYPEQNWFYYEQEVMPIVYDVEPEDNSWYVAQTAGRLGGFNTGTVAVRISRCI